MIFPSSPIIGLPPPELSIIIPAFNESDRLGLCAARFGSALEDGALNPQTTELIFVDDGSTDATALLATQLLELLFPSTHVKRLEQNSGKGAVIRHGAT